MTTHAQFYLTRAAVARELAEGSQLDNVRESHLRAAEAWRESMAAAPPINGLSSTAMARLTIMAAWRTQAAWRESSSC